MVRSRLPVPSLLGLPGALLMLSPEVLMGIPAGFSHMSLIDAGVKKALAFAVEKYNQNKVHSANYFKQLRIQKALSKKDTRNEYHLTLELVETTCEKKLPYKKIQECEQLPGNQKKSTCFFRVIARSPPNKMFFANTSCT